MARYTNFFEERVSFRGRIFIDTVGDFCTDLEETTSQEGLFCEKMLTHILF